MASYYLSIKYLHVLCVILSGGLFALRGLLVLAGSSLGNHVATRWLSYAIDTTLLTTALMLISITHQYPITHDWLSAKLSLLIIYIVLGIFALRRAATRLSKAIFYVAALVVFALMVSIARSHHPLGVFAASLQ